MSRRLLLSLVAFIASMASLVSAPAVAAWLPLQATITFTEQVHQSTDRRCLLIGTIMGGGTAARLGTLQEVTSNDCINPLSTTTFLFVSDDVVLQLDSGEQIFAAYGGTLSSTNGAIRGSYFIYGGTGRFVNASGVGTIEGAENVNFQTGQGTGQIVLNGTLFY